MNIMKIIKICIQTILILSFICFAGLILIASYSRETYSPNWYRGEDEFDNND